MFHIPAHKNVAAPAAQVATQDGLPVLMRIDALTGRALAWAVAHAADRLNPQPFDLSGVHVQRDRLVTRNAYGELVEWDPATEWDQIGSLIELARIATSYVAYCSSWRAQADGRTFYDASLRVAACRAYVSLFVDSDTILVPQQWARG